MTTALILNLFFGVTVVAAIVGLLAWSIATQGNNVIKPRARRRPVRATRRRPSVSRVPAHES